MQKFTNKLSGELSPYLLQHAHNPVDWFNWCDEAFEKAKSEDKPVFLSIGYSTCHWCHVMESESFEDTEVAELMNNNFVNIKVDREERPDIDSVYMQVCQMLTGSGGWPMTIIMTPDKKPFFAGTYFPKQTKWGRIGMVDLIPKISSIWKQDRQKILNSANEITEQLAGINLQYSQNKLSEEILHQAYKNLAYSFDEQHGGFGNAPKFPMPHNLLFLMSYSSNYGATKARDMAKFTLLHMSEGGIFDHIGYGFHRYSTDEHWLLPHFEKMAYDQALLTIAYIDMSRLTGNPVFSSVAEKTIQYVLSDMTSPSGGFYSAQDADSEGTEGKYYLWSTDEIREILGQDAAIFIRFYNLKDKGNFTPEAGIESEKNNLLYLNNASRDTGLEFELDSSEFDKILNSCRIKLLEARRLRVPPQKDDKILTDWNGLMIAALARAGAVPGKHEYTGAAERTVNFILSELTNDGRLRHRIRNGISGISGFLDDYAFFVWGLLETYETTFNAFYIKKAMEMTDTMIQLFFDNVNGGFFQTDAGSDSLLVRNKEFYDGAIPSGNSVALMNLVKLLKYTGSDRYDEIIGKTISAFTVHVMKNPTAFTHFLDAFQYYLTGGFELVIVGDKDDNETQQMLRLINQVYIPYKITIFRDISSSETEIDKILPFISNYQMLDNKTTVYICRNFACEKPISNIVELENVLKKLTGSD